MANKVLVKDFFKKYGDVTFKELPFCMADVLVLAGLSYADYMAASEVMGQYNIWDDKIPLKAFDKHDIIKKLSLRYLSGPLVYYNFFKDVLLCKRYSTLRITHIRNVFSKSKNTQFYAMVYEIDEMRFIIYRGTDNTIAGWKEDFLTAVNDEVPSQKLALEYLEEIVANDKEHNYTIIGHSKGGNLAYYAFFNSKPETKDRIISCYNLDGNGFRNDNYHYKEFKPKIVKIIPSDDVVGSVFDSYMHHTIVKSSAFSIWAHDVTTWQLDPNDYTKLLEVKNLTRASHALKVSLNSWVNNLSTQQIDDFLDFIFTIVDLDKPKTINELFTNLNNNRLKYLKSIDSFPAERKKELRKMTANFLKDYLNAYIRLSPFTQRLTIKSKNNNLIKEKNENA